jgi:hypothetical protein
MATFTLFDNFKEIMADGTCDLDGDTFAVYLSNEAPIVATDTVAADVAAITEQNGYTATNITQTWGPVGSGVMRFAASADVSWTASGGSFGPFQYVVLRDTTATNALVGYWDYGSSISVTTGNSFTVDLDANYSIFTLDG